VKVQKATATKVRQTARPRTPNKDGGDDGSGSDGKSASASAPAGEAATAPEGGRPELEPPSQQKAKPTPDSTEQHQHRSQVLGRRGGRGYYATKVRHRAGR
jgi:hypothetical protein